MSEDKDYFGGRRVELTDLNKDERSRLRPIVGAVVAAILVFGSLLYWNNARAADAAPTLIIKSRIDGDFVKIWRKPCTSSEIKGIVVPHILPLLQEAAMRYEGKDYKACWVERDGNAVIIDEASDVTPLPLSSFAPEGV
jgi:hypothetical protein